MSNPSIFIKGDTYNNVPGLKLRDNNDHFYDFYYTGDSDTLPNDVANGKIFFNSSGRQVGTGSSSGFNIDLTGTTWVFNNQVNDTDIYHRYQINFTDGNSYSWTSLATSFDSKTANIQYQDGKDDTTVYSTSGWVSNAYKTISITGGLDASNPALVAWLLQNATKQ